MTVGANSPSKGRGQSTGLDVAFAYSINERNHEEDAVLSLESVGLKGWSTTSWRTRSDDERNNHSAGSEREFPSLRRVGRGGCCIRRCDGELRSHRALHLQPLPESAACGVWLEA